MPKQIPTEELDAIINIIGDHPDGVRVRSIREGLPYELPPRTLQRRLALLVGQRRLIAEGHRKGRLYRLPTREKTNADPVAKNTTVKETHREIYVPISQEAEAIKQAIRAPVQNRRPVGYQRNFLDDYQPNVTYYLQAETRRRLFDIGGALEGERPAGTYARRIFSRLLIDLSWNSSRLEGNTYSLLETERLLELGEAAESKNAQEAQMILNHKAAIELLVEQADEVGFNRYTILNLHALLSDNLLIDPTAGGRLRRIPVEIEGTVYHPLEVPQLVEERFDQILNTADAIIDPFEQAFFTLVHFAYLQSFEDVNKRVSRLAANIPLIRENLCPLSFVDVPERAYVDGVLAIYELNRVELLRDVFVWAYERSSARYLAVRQSLGEPDPFRLRYRELVSEVVAEVVLKEMDKKATTALARRYASEQVKVGDQLRFIEVIESEIMSLHEGNIARYRLRPAEYRTWKEGWR